jgi:hypothetical protein
VWGQKKIGYKLSKEEFLKNLFTLTRTCDEKTAHPDTVEYFLEKLEPEQIYRVRQKMANRLIRMKALNKFRLLGDYFMVAVDATGLTVYKQRHCPYCLTKKKDGKIIYYYHNVLEAKIVTDIGLAVK